VICNIHVLYNPKRGEMKLGQVCPWQLMCCRVFLFLSLAVAVNARGLAAAAAASSSSSSSSFCER